MAEERIFIAKIEHQTDIRGKDFTIFKSGTSREYPRQEAIERMAKAICSKWGISSCKSCAFKGDGSMCQDFIDGKKSLAEAALNALLGGK